MMIPRPKLRRAPVALLCLAAAGCGATTPEMKKPGAAPFEAVVVPGCPVDAGGALSACLVSRVLWGAVLWERGVAKRFIVSGAAVHSPWVEAEALAAGLAALGVPPERILLEPNAFHTDENMYDSAQIARALGIRTVAVASNGGHAAWGCLLMLDWGQDCRALPLDEQAIKALHAKTGDTLERLRVPAVSPDEWEPLAVREERRARSARRPPRPPSLLLYPAIGMMKSNGEQWIPFAPAAPSLTTWSERLAQLHRRGLRISMEPAVANGADRAAAATGAHAATQPN